MSDDSMSLGDLADELEEEGVDKPDCCDCGDPDCSGDDDEHVPIGMAAGIVAKTLLGQGGIAGVTADAEKPENGITILVLEGFMDAATNGAPDSVYGYKLHFKSVTLAEIEEMGKREEAQVFGGIPGDLTEVKPQGVSGHGTSRDRLKSYMKDAGYSANQILGMDTMAETTCRLIFQGYESADERNLLAATLIAATRLLDVCDEAKKLSDGSELDSAIQEELACLDTGRLDEIDTDSDANSRAVKILEMSFKHIGVWNREDKRMAQETAKMILGIAGDMAKKHPGQPKKPSSPYQQLMEDPDAF